MSYPEPRARADVDVENDYAMLPPVPDVIGEPDRQLFDAVRAALEVEPNVVVEPIVEDRSDIDRFGEVTVWGHWQEMPVIDGDGHVIGWKAPYQSIERFTEQLRANLPEGYDIEMETSWKVVIYHE